MNKSYKTPSQIAVELQANKMMAVSLGEGRADPSKPVLTPENIDWDFWDDEDDSPSPMKSKFFK